MICGSRRRSPAYYTAHWSAREPLGISPHGLEPEPAGSVPQGCVVGYQAGAETGAPGDGRHVDGFGLPYWPDAPIGQSSKRGSPEHLVDWLGRADHPQGSGLRDGTHDWHKLVWELSVRRGLTQALEQCANHG